MSLARSIFPAIRDLAEPGPFPCAELGRWATPTLELVPTDPRLRAIHDGGRAPSPQLDNVVGNVAAWEDWPEDMDYLGPGGTLTRQKLVERALYLDRWETRLTPADGDRLRVLDVGCGIGRFATWMLARGCEVEAVDPDLRSLRALVRHAAELGRAGCAGRLDVHWATGETLPDLAPVDRIVAAEVLCYVEDPVRVLHNLRRTLRPGGVMCFSVEARWGWALAYDSPAELLPALLGDGVVHVEGDRWVRTFEEADLRALLEGAGWSVEELVPTHYIPSGPFDDAAGTLTVDEVLAWEARLRAHPVTRAWNRAWVGVARPA
jgi:2-polyprenyl-3-methyl-5-hydroxy-6-metoxy-1,4-benzoquinol methylase